MLSALCPISNIRLIKFAPTHDQSTGGNLVEYFSPSSSSATSRYSPQASRNLKKNNSFNFWKEIDHIRALEAHYAWHQNFWMRNNLRFEQERSVFINSLDQDTPPTDDQMAQFYRTYLTKYHDDFTNYHIQCWKRNIRLMGMSYKLCWHTLVHFLRSRLSTITSSPLINVNESPQLNK